MLYTCPGYTIGIPDSAMGITFLAAGGSVPEAVAAVVVARQGRYEHSLHYRKSNVTNPRIMRRKILLTFYRQRYNGNQQFSWIKLV